MEIPRRRSGPRPVPRSSDHEPRKIGLDAPWLAGEFAAAALLGAGLGSFHARKLMCHHRTVNLWQLMRWAGALMGVVALAVFMTLLGLDRADKLSSVLSLFFTIAGFVLALVAHVRQRPAVVAVARGGSIAAGGSVRNIRVRSVGAPRDPGDGPPPGVGIWAEDGSIAAGGDVEGSSAYEGPR